MSSTGMLVVSFETDPPPDYFSPELRALEVRIQTLLAPFADTIVTDSVEETSSSPPPAGIGTLIQRGNTFLLTSNFGWSSFDALLESLRQASTAAWLLIYGGIDGEASIMLEVQDGQVITQRERVPVDTLNG